MTKASRYLRAIVLLFVPPAAATLVAFAVWTAGGKARCFSTLLVEDPPLICAAGVELAARAVTFVGFHLLAALPLSLWVAWRERSGQAGFELRRRVLFAAAPVLAAAGWLMHRGGAASITSEVVDALGGFALPALLSLALALELSGSALGRAEAP